MSEENQVRSSKGEEVHFSSELAALLASSED
jgi:hypothetical protein